MRVALVSCVKSKLAHPAPAKDLYISTLFKGLRKYAEESGDAWYILSAEHGVLHPDTIVAPYERTLNTMRTAERQMWAAGVIEKLADIIPAGAEVVILAGERYREHLVPYLERRGHPVVIPLLGLPFGRQLQWLRDRDARS